MRIGCWITKATYTQSEYVTLMAFPLQHWLNESASILLFFFFYGATTPVQSWPSQQYPSIEGDLGLVLPIL